MSRHDHSAHDHTGPGYASPEAARQQPPENHFGWNACSSACHSHLRRDTMIVPGLRSSRIHILDISDPRAPRIKNVIEAEEVKEKLGLSALPGGDRTTEIVQ